MKLPGVNTSVLSTIANQRAMCVTQDKQVEYMCTELCAFVSSGGTVNTNGMSNKIRQTNEQQHCETICG